MGNWSPTWAHKSATDANRSVGLSASQRWPGRYTSVGQGWTWWWWWWWCWPVQGFEIRWTLAFLLVKVIRVKHKRDFSLAIIILRVRCICERGRRGRKKKEYGTVRVQGTMYLCGLFHLHGSNATSPATLYLDWSLYATGRKEAEAPKRLRCSAFTQETQYEGLRPRWLEIRFSLRVGNKLLSVIVVWVTGGGVRKEISTRQQSQHKDSTTSHFSIIQARESWKT